MVLELSVEGWGGGLGQTRGGQIIQVKRKASVGELWHEATLPSANHNMAFVGEARDRESGLGKLRIWLRPDHEDPCVASQGVCILPGNLQSPLEGLGTWERHGCVRG